MFLYLFDLKNRPSVIMEAETIVKAWEAFFLVFDDFYTEHDVTSVEIIGTTERSWEV